MSTRDWRTDGVRAIPADALDPNTPQTPGMQRAVAVSGERVGAGAARRPSLIGIYVVRGLARMRWGERLEYTAEVGPGGFVFVPPYVPHQEINALDDEPLECVLTRSGQEAVVVNLELDAVSEPERVPWIDPAHPLR